VGKNCGSWRGFVLLTDAFIYIGFNYVPLRFVAFLTGVFTLAVIWTRFADQNLNWHLS
jgi:hypothetical protein